MATTKVDRLVFLLEEVGLLKCKADSMGGGAGSYYTTINVLEHTIKELKEKLNNETN